MVKDIMFENVQDYKKTSMMIAMCKCDFKCLKEKGLDISICQNSEIINQEDTIMGMDDLIQKYLLNEITESIVFGGLEPILQFDEVIRFIQILRMDYNCEDDVVIYTGYRPDEIINHLQLLRQFKNIIVKFGRFEPDSEKKFDEILGIELNSSNQWAEKIS